MCSRSGMLTRELGVARDRALQHVERLLLEVVVADHTWRRVGPRHSDALAVELLGGGEDRPGVGAQAATTGSDGEHVRSREVTNGDRCADDDVHAGLLVDGEVVPEEVQRRHDDERVLPGQLVGALLGVGRVDGHETRLELDRTPGPALGQVAAEAAELLVDVLHGGLDARGVLGEAAVGVALRVLQPDDDGLALGLERLLFRALQVGRELAGVLALDGIDRLVGLTGRADAALATACRRGGRSAAGGRGGAARRGGGRRGRGGRARCRGGGAARLVVVVAAGRGEQGERSDHDEWLQHS